MTHHVPRYRPATIGSTTSNKLDGARDTSDLLKNRSGTLVAYRKWQLSANARLTDPPECKEPGRSDRIHRPTFAVVQTR